MESFANNDINEIMKIEGNNKCIDCNAENPTFASTNNAVFLCENCANIHKRLGTNISIIKSLTKDVFTPEEISILKIEQNKEFKYHLKLAEYYRLLLLTEINKEKNSNVYEHLINNKPNPEIGLQLMDSVTVESIQQANQPQNEIVKDVSSIASKIGSFFSSVGQKVSEVYESSGLSQKVDAAKEKISEGVRNFQENHPSVKSAAEKTGEALNAAKNITTETINKVIESETFKNISGAVNNKYNEVMNSETITNFAKKAEEEYINLKIKAGLKPNEGANNAPQGN